MNYLLRCWCSDLWDVG